MEAVRVVHDRTKFTQKLNAFINKLPIHLRKVFSTPRFVVHENDFPVSEQIIDTILKRVNLPVIVKAQLGQCS
jgi:carbamoylphosphate synthase large subunit